MKKQLNVAQCVEVLLAHGLEPRDKWMTVAAYEEPSLGTNSSNGWATEYTKLKTHHYEEMKFLRDVIQEMREQILSQQESIESLQKSCNSKTVTSR